MIELIESLYAFNKSLPYFNFTINKSNFYRSQKLLPIHLFHHQTIPKNFQTHTTFHRFFRFSQASKTSYSLTPSQQPHTVIIQWNNFVIMMFGCRTSDGRPTHARCPVDSRTWYHTYYGFIAARSPIITLINQSSHNFAINIAVEEGRRSNSREFKARRLRVR